MELRTLAAGAKDASVVGDETTEVKALAYDSRKVERGTLFFCVRGDKTDGLNFAAKAVDAGATALVVEKGREQELPELGVPLILVRDPRAAMAPLASRFHEDPTAEMKVIGVTGTNGKTTTAFLIREILEAVGVRCGLLGTVKQVVGGEEEPVQRTTPEAIDLQATFARMLEKKDQICVMEVSSHALALHRCDAIHFDLALFTNLTQDHLDFHSSMEDYFEAKRLLFDMGPRVAIANVDDRYGRQLAEEFRGCLTFSAAGEEANFVARDVKLNATGAEFEIIEWMGGEKAAADSRSHPLGGVVRTQLPGAFNVDNALGAFAAATRVDLDPSIEPDAVACALADAEAPPGRLQPIDEGQAFTVLVDYAHTPDSLDSVLKAVREVTEGRTIAVFGAGGDRDRKKRPLMGRAGAE
ncbi:MAG TPA: UDP-N-acetylmuramoyl-L-alanyl-D-glutamate--2,6-diaminopimelate ligase, partial [Solirubrobacterales bacterium]|nr:UDP-N-acetylmuramoyl-L-alanyl-D-glutamate--2,6-diaminopimelate ligase [Solirubrobacterales bacterium]